MALYKTRPCTQCGEKNRGKRDVCWKCERLNKANSIDRQCLICDAQITDIRRAHLSYCSNDCGRILAEARSAIGAEISRMVKNQDLPKPSDLKCVDCGKDAFDYDHRKYKEPTNVVPVCRSCNIKRGPADDVKALIAEYIGVDVGMVPDVVRKYIERLNAYRASYWAGNRTGQFPSIKQTDQEAA